MSLPRRYVRAGRRLITALDQSGFPMTAAYWIADDDSGIWQLVIATSLCDREGPIEAYTRLKTVLETIDPTSRIDSQRIYLQSPKDRLTLAIGEVFAFGSATEDSILEGTWVDGRSVKAAYLYQLSSP